MLKRLVDAIIFGFGASAGKDLYDGAKEEAKDEATLTEAERREARIRAEAARIRAEERAVDEAKEARRRAAADKAAEEARRKAAAAREAEIDDELAALKKKLGKRS